MRAHNARVRANRQRLRSELAKLERQQAAPRYVTLHASVHMLHAAFTHVEASAEAGVWSEQSDRLVDFAEGEAASSVEPLNALLKAPTT